jgi:sugar porter (SP) family MFS transporter
MALQAERLTEIELVKERYGVEKTTGMIALKEYWRLISTKSLLHRLSLGVAAQSLQQWSGINAIIYYAPTIFEQVGLTGGTISLLATGVVGIVNLVFTIPAVLYVDNFGRKPILFCGATVMAICLAIVAAIIAQFGDDFDNNKTAGNAAVAFIYIFIAAFAVSWGPLAWVVSAEVFPLSMRAKGMSISSSVNWVMNFTVATITPLAIDNIGYKTYIIFMVFMICAALWSLFILPELKGLTLEEVDRVFKDSSGQEDRERAARVAKQIGLDKLAERAAIEHKEDAAQKA